MTFFHCHCKKSAIGLQGSENLIAEYIASRTPWPYSLSLGIKNVPGSFISKVL
jgi:hypothetical protein